MFSPSAFFHVCVCSRVQTSEGIDAIFADLSLGDIDLPDLDGDWEPDNGVEEYDYSPPPTSGRSSRSGEVSRVSEGPTADATSTRGSSKSRTVTETDSRASKQGGASLFTDDDLLAPAVQEGGYGRGDDPPVPQRRGRQPKPPLEQGEQATDNRAFASQSRGPRSGTTAGGTTVGTVGTKGGGAGESEGFDALDELLAGIESNDGSDGGRSSESAVSEERYSQQLTGTDTPKVLPDLPASEALGVPEAEPAASPSAGSSSSSAESRGGDFGAQVEAVAGMKVVELKEKCKEMGLRVSGKKAELQQRIVDALGQGSG